MLFFPENKNLNCLCSLSVKKIATLQVRLKKYPPAFRKNRGKRVWLSASLRGSLAVEASFALPLFLFASFIMMFPMKLMDRQRQVQAAVDSVCEEMSQYAYIIGETEDIEGILSIIYARQRVLSKIDQSGMENISFLRSKILQTDHKIELVMDYDMRIPFSVFGFDRMKMEVRSVRRAWIGSRGEKEEAGYGADDGDRIVFIGKNSTRYHYNRDCHYLYNDISAVSYERIGEKRNADGKKYYPCRICGMNGASVSEVYIMPRGNSYHTSRYCTAIISYAEGVRLSSVMHLGACSYCSQ